MGYWICKTCNDRVESGEMCPQCHRYFGVSYPVRRDELMEPKVGEWWWVEQEEGVPGHVTSRRVVKLTEKCVCLAWCSEQADPNGVNNAWYRKSALTFVERCGGER